MQLSTAATKWCPHRATTTTTTATNTTTITTVDMQCHFLCHREAINLEHINMDVRWKCQPNMSLSVLGNDLGIGIWIWIGIGIRVWTGHVQWPPLRLPNASVLTPEPRRNPNRTNAYRTIWLWRQFLLLMLRSSSFLLLLLLLQMKWRKKKVSAVYEALGLCETGKRVRLESNG